MNHLKYQEDRIRENIREVTSFTNPIIKNVKALRLKKFRDQRNAFIAEGLKLIIHALDKGWIIETLIFEKSQLQSQVLQDVIKRTVDRNGEVLSVNEKILSTITRCENPQRVVGVFSQHYKDLETIDPQLNDVFVVLDRIRDPGNLGTIIRTIDAVGGKGIILAGTTTDPFSMEAVRASMGSIFSVPIVRCGYETLIKWQKQFPDLLVVGTDPSAPCSYTSLNFSNKKILLVMGNEQKGMCDILSDNCNKRVSIPQEGHADSLNLAVATGVMLFEIRRNCIGLNS